MASSTVLFSAFPQAGFIDADPRADGAVRRVFMAEGRIVIDRSVEGMAMRLGIPCSAYQGVVLTLSGTAEQPRFVLRLAHADPELSVVLHDGADDTTIVADWRAAAALTGLPRYLERTPGELEPAEARLGALALGPACVVRRRGAVAIRRRPRFLTRRRMGERRLMKRVPCERVISAPV